MAAGDEDNDSLYFASTQMQARYEELEAAEKCDTNINHRIAELQTFKMTNSSSNAEDGFETLAKGKRIRERNYGETRKTKPKKIKTMTSLMANTFNGNRQLRESQETDKKESNPQLSILKFFSTVKPLCYSGGSHSHSYELSKAVYDKLDWLDIMQCIKILYSKKLAKRKKERLSEWRSHSQGFGGSYPGDIGSIWTYASTPPPNVLGNEDIKTLYDLSEEDFLMSDAIETKSSHDGKQDPPPHLVGKSQSLVDPKTVNKNSHDYVVSDSSPEPEPLIFYPPSSKESSKESLPFFSPRNDFFPLHGNSLEYQKNQNDASFHRESSSDVLKTSGYPKQYNLTEASNSVTQENLKHVNDAISAKSLCSMRSEFKYITGNQLNLHEGKKFGCIASDEKKCESKLEKSRKPSKMTSVSMLRGVDVPPLFSKDCNTKLETYSNTIYGSHYSPSDEPPERGYSSERHEEYGSTSAYERCEQNELVSYLRVDDFFSRFDWAKEKHLGTSISVSKGRDDAGDVIEDSSDEDFNPFCILRLSRRIALETNNLQQLNCLSNDVHVNRPILQVPSSPQLENSNCLDPFDYGPTFDKLPVHSQ